MNKPVKCSRCGSKSPLNLVSLRYNTEDEAGRLLVYCAKCRNDFSSQIDINIPLDSVSDEVFIDLYPTNKTSADPITAAEIVFGTANRELVQAAQMYLANKNR
jgi:hypothetical protein